MCKQYLAKLDSKRIYVLYKLYAIAELPHDAQFKETEGVFEIEVL